MSTPFFHKVFWFLALYFHLKVYHIEALSFVSVVFSSRQENRKECLKFLRQDLKCLFEVKGGNQFLSYFLSVIVLNFLLYDVKQVVCYPRLGFFMQSFIFFAIVWWVMFYYVFCCRLEENRRTQRSGKECPGSYPQVDQHGLNNKRH